MSTTKRVVLIAEDDKSARMRYHTRFEEKGWRTLEAKNAGEAFDTVINEGGNIDFILLDVSLPAGNLKVKVDELGTGVAAARAMKGKYPDIKIAGCSVDALMDQRQWFLQNDALFFDKERLRRESFDSTYRSILRFLGVFETPPKCFIVHGHDGEALRELEEYIEQDLKLGRPTVLVREPSQNQTIIEKFEETARDSELAFVLLTPDDEVVVHASDDNDNPEHETWRRARQNVIFELGYFFAMLGRKSGRVITLYKQPIELPSDIWGLLPIDITSGVRLADEQIRKELKGWVERP